MLKYAKFKSFYETIKGIDFIASFKCTPDSLLKTHLIVDRLSQYGIALPAQLLHYATYFMQS